MNETPTLAPPTLPLMLRIAYWLGLCLVWVSPGFTVGHDSLLLAMSIVVLAAIAHALLFTALARSAGHELSYIAPEFRPWAINGSVLGSYALALVGVILWVSVQ